MKNDAKGLTVALCLVLSASLASTVAVRADTITLYQSGNFSYSDAGEFGAVIGKVAGSMAIPYAPMPSPAHVAGYDFQTFCVQSTVTFNPGVQYYAGEGLTDGAGNTLKWGAAWLYDQFWNGGLAADGYAYNSFGSARDNSAGALQYAIWKFQGQLGGVGSWGESGDGITLYNDAVAAVLAMHLAGGKTATSAYLGEELGSGNSVAILRLTDQPNGLGNPHQNQLVENVAPLPSTASTGIVLLASLAFLPKLRQLRKAST